MDIETVAHDTPEKIITFSVDPATGVMPHHGRTVAKALKLRRPSPSRRKTCKSVSKLYAPSSRRTWRCSRSTR
jgi:succinyl-CoA synthetase beta subunit